MLILHLRLSEIEEADWGRGELNKRYAIHRIENLKIQEPTKVFKCQEVDSKTTELEVKEVLQEEPGEDLDLVEQDKIHPLLR